MALLIVRFQDTSEFSIPSHVKSGISRQHNQSGAAVSPANHILNKTHTFTKLKKKLVDSDMRGDNFTQMSTKNCQEGTSSSAV